MLLFWRALKKKKTYTHRAWWGLSFYFFKFWTHLTVGFVVGHAWLGVEFIYFQIFCTHHTDLTVAGFLAGHVWLGVVEFFSFVFFTHITAAGFLNGHAWLGVEFV